MLQQDINALYGHFITTIKEFGTFLLSCSDEEIEFCVFEEFDTDSISFLYWRNLRKLLDANLIDKQIYDLSLKLRGKFRKLERTSLWNVQSIRHEKKWIEILLLSDKIKELVKVNKNV